MALYLLHHTMNTFLVQNKNKPAMIKNPLFSNTHTHTHVIQFTALVLVTHSHTVRELARTCAGLWMRLSLSTGTGLQRGQHGSYTATQLTRTSTSTSMHTWLFSDVSSFIKYNKIFFVLGPIGILTRNTALWVWQMFFVCLKMSKTKWNVKMRNVVFTIVLFISFPYHVGHTQKALKPHVCFVFLIYFPFLAREVKILLRQQGPTRTDQSFYPAVHSNGLQLWN